MEVLNPIISILEELVIRLIALVFTPVLGLLSLFTFKLSFSWLYVAIIGILIAIQRLVPKNIRNITISALSLGIILMWMALFASYHDLPEARNLLVTPSAKGGFPIAAFEYPPAALGSDEPPTNSWGLFYANLGFWIAIGSIVAILLRKKLNDKLIRILFIAGIAISMYGLGYVLLRFD